MDLNKLFVDLNPLYEAGRNSFYSNIAFLTTEDKEWLKTLGKGMFNGFNKETYKQLDEFKKTSYLYKSIISESAYVTEDYKDVFWQSKDKDYQNQKGYTFGSLEESTWKSSTQYTYKAPLRPENIICYFPVLENWTRHFMVSPKLKNETVETREIVKSISIPLSRFKQNKNIIVNLSDYELVECLNRIQ